jgi:hypothetical protein
LKQIQNLCFGEGLLWTRVLGGGVHDQSETTCVSVVDEFNNKQTAHCVTTQAFLSSSNNMGYKWYETGRIWLSNLSQDERI